VLLAGRAASKTLAARVPASMARPRPACFGSCSRGLATCWPWTSSCPRPLNGELGPPAISTQACSQW